MLGQPVRGIGGGRLCVYRTESSYNVSLQYDVLQSVWAIAAGSATRPADHTVCNYTTLCNGHCDTASSLHPKRACNSPGIGACRH